MGIEIHVADVGALSAREIDALATFYVCLSGRNYAVVDPAKPAPDSDMKEKSQGEWYGPSSDKKDKHIAVEHDIDYGARSSEHPETAGPAFTIAPNDAPDAGAPNLLDEAAAAFGGSSNPNTGNISPAPTSVELDAKGLPWDNRIHSSSRAKNADNTWRAKRGVAADVIAATEVQLRQLAALPAAPGLVLDGTTGQFIPNVPSPTNLPLGAPPIPAPPAPSTPSAATMTYAQMSMKIMGAIDAKLFDHAAVMAACQKHGLSSLPALQLRPDYIPIVIAELFPNG